MAILLLGPLLPRSRPLVLEALTPLGLEGPPLEVAGAEDLGRALVRAEGDLLILDLDTPGAFDCLAKVAEQRSSIPLIGLGTPRTPDVEGYESRFPSLYFPLLTYLQKPLVPQTLTRTIAQEWRQLARGVLEGLSLPGLLQMLHMEGKTCTIRVTSGQRVGFFYLRAGKLINARYREVEGYEAALHLLAAEAPRAEIHSQLHNPEERIHARLEEVLLEAMRLQDETGGNPPPLEAGNEQLPDMETGKWATGNPPPPKPRSRAALWVTILLILLALGAGSVWVLRRAGAKESLRPTAPAPQPPPPEPASTIALPQAKPSAPVEASAPQPEPEEAPTPNRKAHKHPPKPQPKTQDRKPKPRDVFDQVR